MTPFEFSKIAYQIPAEPGIYKYFSETNELIYVGKAKHLKKRISSYFNKNLDNKKTIELVSKIHHIEFTIVNSEEDAFLLENNLIKQYQPRYNISLTDDKTYPLVVIKKERSPRVFVSRKKISDGSEYFGPYTSVESVNEMLFFIKQQFPIRTCKLNLSADNISKKKFKVCLEYHLGNCKGPCEGLQSLEEYNEGIEQLRALLKGNTAPLMRHLKSIMAESSENLEFEKAAHYQNKIQQLIQFQSKSSIVNSKMGTIDVVAIVENNDGAAINYLAINNGSIIHTKSFHVQKKLNESISDLLIYSIAQLRNMFGSIAKELIVPFQIVYPEKQIKITVPLAGEKKKLLDLAEKNAQYFATQQRIKKPVHENTITEKETEDALIEMKESLQLQVIPSYIECFDNSNIHGTNAVAAMVCFRNGYASKTEYRHFNIKTVEGINDFASMKEIVFRRYKKITEDNLPLPDLIIIDGGKGQLSAAMESIEMLNLLGKTTLVGLAKNKEELFFYHDQQSLILPWNSKGLNLIRRIRDEVHRFGITFHRNKRSKHALSTELSDIKGIGETTITLLLKEYKSINKIREVTPDDLIKLIGLSKTRILTDYLQQMNGLSG